MMIYGYLCWDLVMNITIYHETSIVTMNGDFLRIYNYLFIGALLMILRRLSGT